MKMRPFFLSLLCVSLASTVDAKNPAGGRGFVNISGTASTPTVDGAATRTVLVPIGGISTDIQCVDEAPSAGNTVVSINLGPHAVVTGIGAVGGFTAFNPSYLSEATAAIRGSVAEESGFFTFSNTNFPGTETFDFAPIDLTSNASPNIQVGATGILNIELCEGYDDPEVEVDGRFAAGSLLLVACFNCVDPFGAVGLPAPALSTGSLIGLILSLGLVGGLAARRFS